MHLWPGILKRHRPQQGSQACGPLEVLMRHMSIKYFGFEHILANETAQPKNIQATYN